MLHSTGPVVWTIVECISTLLKITTAENTTDSKWVNEVTTWMVGPCSGPIDMTKQRIIANNRAEKYAKANGYRKYDVIKKKTLM